MPIERWAADFSFGEPCRLAIAQRAKLAALLGEVLVNAGVGESGERPGITLNVNNVQPAAEELLKWNQRGCPLGNRAVRVCIAALAGEVSPEAARDAFREAEEGVLRERLDGPFGKTLTSNRKPKPVRKGR
ncbi:DUF982 domain-containing protein [Mesorhizobium sp. M1156]|uniref:DUF982 domain-containing protein n=1 Tax=unclassified Mesorhizobium TaxID=325217 RepID=UPI003337056A